MRISVSVITGLCLLGLAALPGLAQPVTGDAQRGRALIIAVGCGSCHIIPGIGSAQGLAGPPLDYMSRRIFIAGLLRNTPDNMIHWIMHPQKVVPGNAMPEMGLTTGEARDIAAYLATLK